MKEMRKLTALLLVLGLICMLFAGCGSPAASDSGTAPAEAPAAEESAAAAPEEPAPAEEAPETPQEPSAAEEAAQETPAPEAVVPGQIASDAINNGLIDRTKELPLTENGETLTYWCETNFGASTEITSYSEHYGLKYAQEQTGVHLEFTECNMTVAAEQFSLMVASNSLCDIIVGFERYYTPGPDNAVEEDLILDLNDYLDAAPIYKQLLETDPQWYESMQTDAGRLTSFKTLYRSFAWIKESVAVRGDWLDDLGMDVPMTYDDYFEVLSAFKSNYDPAYCLDIGSALGNKWFEGGYGVSVSSSGSSSTADFYVEDGVVHDGFTSDRFRDYLTMLHEWYEAGLISSDYITIGDLEFFENQYSGLIASGQFGCVNGAGGLLESYAAFSDDEDFRFVPSYAPRLSEDSTLCYLTPSTLTNEDYSPSISAGCDNVDLALGFLDYFFTEEGELVAQFGVEGVSWVRDESGRAVLTEVITSAADTNGALMAYKVNICCIGNPNESFRALATENSQEIMQFWTDDQNELMSHGNNAYYPSDATLTAEESELAATYLADIATYVSESVPGFIMGTKSLDEFDDYCAALKGMGIDDVVAVYQAAYDRYAS